MDATRFLEVKHTLAGDRQEFECQLLERSQGHAVLLYRLERAWDVAGLRLPSGTRTVAYYWEDRPYNVYHWLHPEGPTLGYYFNISTATRISRDRVEWRDLGVDLLVQPGAQPRFLDEEELPEDLNVRLWEIIWRAKAELLSQHRPLLGQLEARSRELLE